MSNTNYSELLFNKKKGGIGLDTILLILLTCILLALVILVFNFSLCKVSGDSMNDTLISEQYVLTLKTSKAKTGDIVVFHKTDSEGRKIADSSGKVVNYIKRVIAVGGETIRFVKDDDKYMHVEKLDKDTGNYERMDQGYIKDGNMLIKPNTEEMRYKTGDDIYVEPEYYFVMGDNRNHSTDSRWTTIGMVKTSEVTGRAVQIIKPGSAAEWFYKLIYRPDENE